MNDGNFRPIQMEFVAHGQDYEDVDEDVRERLIESLAIHIQNAEYHSWDDDAYGFILMGGTDVSV